jgi:hypothetical protein
MVVRDEDVRDRLKELDEHIRKEYIESHPKQERDWRTYEQEFSRRTRDAMKALDPLIHEAVSSIRIEPRTGRPDSLTLEQRVKLLLIKQLVGESNRMFANMLDLFSMLSGIEVSYKTVERLYSDEEVMMALHNLQVILLKRRGSRGATPQGTAPATLSASPSTTRARPGSSRTGPRRARRRRRHLTRDRRSGHSPTRSG